MAHGRWRVTPFWKGRTVAILASGPSMSQSVADSVRHLPRIAVNTTYELARDAQILYAADYAWWEANPGAMSFAGLKVTTTRSGQPGFPGVLTLENSGKTGFDENPERIRTGGNSGYQALHIALHSGASRILLLGFDLRGGHWHGDHPTPLRNTHAEVYEQWVKNFDTLFIGGVEVLNCTPDSALKRFPIVQLEDALESRVVSTE